MTVFIPIFRRSEARIVFLTDIWKTLLCEESARIVLIVPSFMAAELESAALGERVTVEPINTQPPARRSFFDAFFYRLSLFYADTPLSREERRAHILLEWKRPVRYALSLALLFVFGRAHLLRRALRFLDLLFVRDRSFDSLFARHHPDVVFIPGTTHSSGHALLREAKRRGIRSVVLAASAPEEIAASRLPLRITPSCMLVENDLFKQEATFLFDMPKENVLAVGNPLFDRYRESPVLSRNDFCSRFHIDPSHRIILFASAGNLHLDERLVLKDIDNAIEQCALPSDLSILVRHYPEKNMYIGDSEYSDRVAFDNSGILFAKDKTYLAVLADEMATFTDSFVYADVVISTAGKLLQTAAVFQNPIINLAYDHSRVPPHQSVSRYYTEHYPAYRHAQKCGAAVLARAKSELVDLINEALTNPLQWKSGQACVVKKLSPYSNGEAGKRVGRAVCAV